MGWMNLHSRDVKLDAREAPAQFDRGGQLTALLIGGADGGSLGLGHGEHARSMELVAQAQQAERWVASGDGCHDSTRRADREMTIQSVFRLPLFEVRPTIARDGGGPGRAFADVRDEPGQRRGPR